MEAFYVVGGFLLFYSHSGLRAGIQNRKAKRDIRLVFFILDSGSRPGMTILRGVRDDKMCDPLITKSAPPFGRGVLLGCGVGIRTRDLEVMGLARCHFSTPLQCRTSGNFLFTDRLPGIPSMRLDYSCSCAVSQDPLERRAGH